MKKFIFKFSTVVIVSLLLVQSPRVCGKQRTLAGDKESKSASEKDATTKAAVKPTSAPKNPNANAKAKAKDDGEPSTDADVNVNGDEDEDKKCSSPDTSSDFHKLIGDCFKFCKPDSGQMKCKPPKAKEKTFKCKCCCVS